ncbi:KH domain-containing protein [Haematococcus lacustris]|uniref:KH domain-containing protein n=1 Tax=Haematococcus lacustris TaxID=44745 RepID=A0A699YWI3_HAELA|nr:KH domain-containing protein [Haematococcus lacustris]
MPKVPRKDAKAALQEAPMAVDMEAGHEQAGQEQPGLPDKPNFTPLSAAEQGGKLEFRRVEIKTTAKTVSPDVLQKAADFVHAFLLGFEVRDAIALLRLDDLYVECFEIKDVKTLRGEHMSRAIGRLSGKSGKTKFTIENATKTRLVLADQRIHILGSFQNIRVARDALCALIMGSPPAKVYSKLRSVCARLDSS